MAACCSGKRMASAVILCWIVFCSTLTTCTGTAGSFSPVSRAQPSKISKGKMAKQTLRRREKAKRRENVAQGVSPGYRPDNDLALKGRKNGFDSKSAAIIAVCFRDILTTKPRTTVDVLCHRLFRPFGAASSACFTQGL